ncbi:MAG: ABC transporter permease [Spirochaetaceae bacterium]
MLITLILRNVLRNLTRLLPMMVIIIVAFAALLLGNGVLASSVRALRESYVNHLSGHMSVAAAGEKSFTIFGSEQLLVGEYLVPPTLVDYRELESAVRQMPEVAEATGLISAVARVRAGGRQQDSTVFGIEFDGYRRMFPDLELTAGEFPAPGERGILLQEPWTEDALGSEALLAVARGSSFTLRGMPVRGLFSYPVEDELLGQVALTDPETARSLNGYIRGGAAEAEVPEGQRDLLEGELDSMFGGGDPEPESDAGGPGDDGLDNGEPADGGSAAEPGDRDPEALLQGLEAEREARAARETVAGAWNFLLVKLEEPGSYDRVRRRLIEAGYSEENGYLIRDWRETVGGSAQIVGYLQLMFNAGLFFVAFGAAVIATNALVLSVLERTKEIGTFRALGAGKGRVAAMVGGETLLVVVGAAALGLAAGGAALIWLNGAELRLENQYIEILFGGEPISGTVSFSLLLSHLGGALILAVVALLYPLKKALSIAPVEAMAE